jgi:hypothetical protein
MTCDLQRDLLNPRGSPSRGPPAAFGQTWVSSIDETSPSCKMRGGGVNIRDISEGPTARGRSFVKGLLVVHVLRPQHQVQVGWSKNPTHDVIDLGEKLHPQSHP